MEDEDDLLFDSAFIVNHDDSYFEHYLSSRDIPISTVMNQIYADIDIYVNYYQDLLSSTNKETIYRKYSQKLNLNVDMEKIIRSINHIFLKTCDNYNLDPLIDITCKCIRDFSLGASNLVLKCLPDLCRCVSVCKESVSGFYYCSEVAIENPTLHYLISYVCYMITGDCLNQEYLKCCSSYVLAYIRKIRLNGTLLKTFGFEKVQKTTDLDENNYFCIKVLTKQNTFEFYRRPYNKVSSSAETGNSNIDTSLGTNTCVALCSVLNATVNDYKYAYDQYKMYYNYRLTIRKKPLNITRPETVENTTHLQESSAIDFINMNIISDSSVFNSLCDEVDKEFIGRLKSKSSELINIHCYINNASCSDMNSKYLLKYDQHKLDEPKHFTLEKILNTSLNTPSINANLNNHEINNTNESRNNETANHANSVGDTSRNHINTTETNETSTDTMSHNSLENVQNDTTRTSSFINNAAVPNKSIINKKKGGKKRTNEGTTIGNREKRRQTI